jgi:hypothetical protein
MTTVGRMRINRVPALATKNTSLGKLRGGGSLIYIWGTG